ncbi:MAG: C-terminal helicase domain-containing protein, partial [Xanthobacteraceae bacterium]
ESVEQRLVHVDRAGKPGLLVDILRREPIDRALVFTRTKRGADKVVRALVKAGLAAEAIHGNKSQGQRERVLAAFRAGRVRTLIATDIAARGIDVEGISHVVNYDLPNIPESYVHRIGRTARAGADGVAISFCDAEERAFLRDIEKLIRMSIPATDRRSDRRPQPEPREHRANGAANGKPPRPQHNGHNGKQHEGKPQDRNPANRNHQDRRGDHPQQRGSHQHHRRDERPAAHDGSIGAIAFMQPKRGARRPSGANTAQRPPR